MGYFECFTCGEEMEYNEAGDFECDNCNAVMRVDIDIDQISEGKKPYFTHSFNEFEFNRSLSYWEVGEITGIAYLEIPLFIPQFRKWVRENYFEEHSFAERIKLFWSLHKEDWKHCFIYREKSQDVLY